ncbi:MAG: hypothetical protein KC474_05565 [Cyanobacteria bacterium HKST-UBA04]|nr:hypothetical protein [Cyanobacteria bacterium HKST-UBA04]MCA9841989.1 hypothetical protein [Cyanobacteria bacterium HKST-UBA03]
MQVQAVPAFKACAGCNPDLKQSSTPAFGKLQLPSIELPRPQATAAGVDIELRSKLNTLA